MDCLDELSLKLTALECSRWNKQFKQITIKTVTWSGVVFVTNNNFKCLKRIKLLLLKSPPLSPPSPKQNP